MTQLEEKAIAYQKEKTIENAIPLIKKLIEGVGANMLAFYTSHEGNPNISVREKGTAIAKFGTVAMKIYDTKGYYKSSTLRKTTQTLDVPKVALNYRRFLYARRR